MSWISTLRKNWAAAISLSALAGLTFLLVQAIRAAHGSVRGAMLMISGDNFVPAIGFLAGQYAPFVLLALILWAAPIAAFDSQGAWGVRSRWMLGIGSLTVLVLLILVIPLYAAALFLLFIAAQMWIARVLRGKFGLASRGASSGSDGSRAKKAKRAGSGKSGAAQSRMPAAAETALWANHFFRHAIPTSIVAVALLVPMALAFIGTELWIPVESLTFNDGSESRRVLVVRESEDWMTFMHSASGRFTQVRTHDVLSRSFCESFVLPNEWRFLFTPVGVSPAPTQSC